MEGEEREALAMPVREEVDQLSAFQQLAEAPQPMTWAMPVPARHSSSIDFGSVKVRRTTNRYFDRLVARA